MRVIQIIIGVLVIYTFYGCGKPDVPKYKLPDKVEHPKPGKVGCITPRELIDSLNSGAELTLIYIHDVELADSEIVIDLPGMTTMFLGEVLYVADTLAEHQPLYLICQFGDDSRRMAKELAKRGIDSYFLDGGGYRLAKQMRENGWKIDARAWKRKRY